MQVANIKSAKKRIITSRKSQVLNNDVKSSMKTSIKKLDKSINEGNLEEATNRLAIAVKSIDKAQAKGVIKKNTAARYKSNLTKKFNQLSSK